MNTVIKKAIFPAAGLGTRFLPATKASPKEMLPIVDKPLIQYGVEECLRCGIDEFIIITGKNKRPIEDHFDSAFELEEKLRNSGKHELLEELNKLQKIKFAYIRQREALGLGHAVLCAKPFVKDEPFAVILSDDLLSEESVTLLEMIKIYEEKKAPVIAVERVSPENVQRYGIIKGNLMGGVYEITDMVEKPKPESAPSNMGIIGRYILTPEIFDILENQAPGAGGEIQLTDALKTYVRKKPIYGYAIKEKRYDAGDKLGYLEATVDFALSNKDLADGFRKFLFDRLKSF